MIKKLIYLAIGILIALTIKITWQVFAIQTGVDFGEKLEGKVRAFDVIQMVDDAGSTLFDIYVGGQSSVSDVPTTLENTLIIDTHTISNLYNMEIAFWDTVNNRPSLIINEGAVARATTFDRSLQVGKTKGVAPIDSDYTICSGFNYAECDTSTTGADLVVEDDIEAKGSIFTQENFLTDGGILIKQNSIPENPPVGYRLIYIDSQGDLVIRNPNGTEKRFLEVPNP